MKRCASCALALEEQEPICPRCLRLTSSSFDGTKALRQLDRARSRRRFNVVITWIMVLSGTFPFSLAALIMLPSTMRGPGNSPGYWLVSESILFGVVGGIMLGAPGRSWSRYAFDGWLREGVPRWWKGLARGSVFAIAGIIVNEYILRWFMENRREAALNTGLTNADVDGIIGRILLMSYALIAAMLLWSFIGDKIGRVLLPITRRHLLEPRAARAEPGQAHR